MAPTHLKLKGYNKCHQPLACGVYSACSGVIRWPTPACHGIYKYHGLCLSCGRPLASFPGEAGRPLRPLTYAGDSHGLGDALLQEPAAESTLDEREGLLLLRGRERGRRHSPLTDARGQATVGARAQHVKGSGQAKVWHARGDSKIQVGHCRYTATMADNSSIKP